MNGLDTQVARKLAAKVEAEMTKRTGDLGRGLAADFADYRKRCGHIAGLAQSLELLKDAESELLGQSPTEKR